MAYRPGSCGNRDWSMRSDVRRHGTVRIASADSGFPVRPGVRPPKSSRAGLPAWQAFDADARALLATGINSSRDYRKGKLNYRCPTQIPRDISWL